MFKNRKKPPFSELKIITGTYSLTFIKPIRENDTTKTRTSNT